MPGSKKQMVISCRFFLENNRRIIFEQEKIGLNATVYAGQALY